MNGNGNGTWRWIAGLLGVLVVSALPGYVALFRTGAQVNEIQQTQQEVLQRISVLEAQNAVITQLLLEARRKLDQLNAQP